MPQHSVTETSPSIDHVHYLLSRHILPVTATPNQSTVVVPKADIMANKKIITVFGATGGQGGSVADIFLHDPKLKSDWTVRAVTRNVTKESAKKLEREGAEVVSVSSLQSF